MSTKLFNPVQGFSIEFSYDRDQISSAVSTQISIWFHGITHSFLGLCEDVVDAGRSQREKANLYAAAKTVAAKSVLSKALHRITGYVKKVIIDLVRATNQRIQSYLLNLCLPTLETIIKACFNGFDRFNSACEQYVAKSYDIALAEKQSPIILPSVYAALIADDESEVDPQSEPQGAPIAEPVADAPTVASTDSPEVVKSMAAQAPRSATTKIDGIVNLRRKARELGIRNTGRMNTAQLLEVLGDRVVQE
jgi:hypothetical protein